MFRSQRLSPALIFLAVAGVAAVIIGARELAFWAGMADTPSVVRTYFKGYERPSHLRPPWEIEGPWVTRFDAAVDKAYWLKRDLVPKLEPSKVDAFRFYELLNGPIDGKFGTIFRVPPVPVRNETLDLLAKRDAYFSVLGQIDRDIRLSQADPVANPGVMSPDEKRILEIADTITRTTLAAWRADRDVELKALLTAERDKAYDDFRAYQDAYLNPAISTATLVKLIHDSFTPLSEKNAKQFEQTIDAIARASDPKVIDALVPAALFLVNESIREGDPRSRPFLSYQQQVLKEKEFRLTVGLIVNPNLDVVAACKALVGAYPDADIPTYVLSQAVSQFGRYRKQALQRSAPSPASAVDSPPRAR